MLKAAFDASRFIYNHGGNMANAMKANGGRPTAKQIQKDLRAAVSNNEPWAAAVQWHQRPDWANLPYEVRDSAVRDIAKAMKSTDAQMEAAAVKKGEDAKEGTWEFKYRTRKDATESLTLRSRDLDRATPSPWFRALFGTSSTRHTMRSKQPLPATFGQDVRLFHDKMQRKYYLIVPVPPPPPKPPDMTCTQTTSSGSDSQAPRAIVNEGTSAAAQQATAAPAASTTTTDRSDLGMTEYQRQLILDPGVRTFMTGYDPAGLAVEFGGGPTNGFLWRLANTANGIRARMMKPGVSHQKKRRMRRAADRIQTRIRNMVDELHYKFAAWVCANYDLVLLPEFQVSNMVKRARGRRRINRTTVSRMYTLAHCRFREFMKHKAKQRGVTLLLVNEAYTSKTCGNCGRMHNVGSRKVFHCPFCHVIVDRDIAAARNIAIKFVHDFLLSC